MAFFPAPLPEMARSPQLALSVNLTPSAINANTFSSQTFNIAGLDPIAHQFVDVGALAWATATGTVSQTTGILVMAAYVSAAGVLTITFLNNTAGSLTPAAGFYSIVVF